MQENSTNRTEEKRRWKWSLWHAVQILQITGSKFTFGSKRA